MGVHSPKYKTQNVFKNTNLEGNVSCFVFKKKSLHIFADHIRQLAYNTIKL